MQIKTIKKTIVNKLNEWLETITDSKLRGEVKSELLLSGGSITTMLLNEDVNDFDIYIKSKETLVKLVEYYTKGLAVQVLKAWEKEALLKPYNEGILSLDEDYKNKFILAVESMKENQVKLFMNVAGGLKLNEEATEEQLKNYIPLYISPNAISLSNKIQIVVRFHGTAEEIHKTFDFIHATNYFTFNDGLVTNIAALQSILTKQLSYQGSLYPLTSIIRMKKFIKRNWNINAGEMLKCMFQISELDLQNVAVLEDQLIGVDVAYFETLIAILKNSKKETITAQWLGEVIDKVFNDADVEL
jgi:hypothetical protein